MAGVQDGRGCKNWVVGRFLSKAEQVGASSPTPLLLHLPLPPFSLEDSQANPREKLVKITRKVPRRPLDAASTGKGGVCGGGRATGDERALLCSGER